MKKKLPWMILLLSLIFTSFVPGNVYRQYTIHVLYPDGRIAQFKLCFMQTHRVLTSNNGALTINEEELHMLEDQPCSFELIGLHAKALFIQNLYRCRDGRKGDCSIPFEVVPLRELFKLPNDTFYIHRNENCLTYK